MKQDTDLEELAKTDEHPKEMGTIALDREGRENFVPKTGPTLRIQKIT